MSRNLNLKIMSIYKSSTIKKLTKIFGEDYVFPLPKSKAVGLSYNYDDRELKTVFEKIPFNETQQLYITPSHFLRIIFNLITLGIKPSIDTNIELSYEDKQLLERGIYNLYKTKDPETLLELQHILEEIEEEQGAYLASVSFFNNNERVSLKANGIIFTDQSTINLTDEILNYRAL
ncbi:hypothetical protein [Peribacillus frigoritolerans]|uniref:hypothetical protein n=1 Tax=Peribacillus frigoritolerans TaxID=450367 RepID=UPI003015E746